MNLNCKVTGAEYQPGSFSDAVHYFIEADTDEEEALKKLFSAPTAFFQWFSGLLMELEVHTQAALDGKPLSALEHWQEKWLKVAVVLLNNRFPSEARNLVLRFYQVVRAEEIRRTERFHKGTILFWLGRANHDLGLLDQARNEFLLALIEDVRSSSQGWVQLPAREWLVDKFQIDAATVDDLGATIQDFIKGRIWDALEPESIWLYLKPQRRRISRAPLDFVRAIAGEFLGRVRVIAPTSKEAGDRLEMLMAYLFAVEQGFEVIGSTRSPDSQNDILIRNRHHDAAIASLGDYLLVECKNWGKPVGAPVVREFAGRLRVAKVKTGILASRSGITGQKKKGHGTGARETISKEYVQQSSVAVLVIDEPHLVDLANGRRTLSTELLEQFENVRFDIR